MAAMTTRVPRNPLGGTGLEVSALGFGASPLGGVFRAVEERTCIESVHTAFASGINLFDTSPFYGATKSETVLGRALRDLPRSEVVISTKVGRYGQDQFDFSAERVTRSVTESLERLQVPYIDIIQCHDIEFGDLDQVVRETLPALQALKAKGLVRHVGITGLPLSIFNYVLDRADPGAVDVVLSYCHNTLADTSLVTALPYLQSKGVGVINASPLSMGLLTQQGPPEWHPAPAEVQRLCRQAAQHAASRGVDIARIALASSLRAPGIASTLVGMCTAEEVAANVATTLQALGAQHNPQADLEAQVEREISELLAPVHGTTWPSGRPGNN